jgi:hypothetical protein
VQQFDAVAAGHVDVNDHQPGIPGFERGLEFADIGGSPRFMDQRFDSLLEDLVIPTSSSIASTRNLPSLIVRFP